MNTITHNNPVKTEKGLETSILNKYGMNILNTPFVSDDDIQLGLGEKYLIVEKLIEAHEFACANVMAGNITGRGFATNVCTVDRAWSIGTNFNNTRNDISSICGERSAILASYNEALLRYSRRPRGKFDFKIKYLCMASNISLEDLTEEMIAPCEDCLSWLNTNKYFNFNTLIFSFERKNGELVVRASRLTNFLPYKTMGTSNEYSHHKEIRLSRGSKISFEKFNLNINSMLNLLEASYLNYKNSKMQNISNQNIACSILVNDEVLSSVKIDWTKRWNIEPLELCVAKAIEKYQGDMVVKAISYFGDEFSKTGNEVFNDGLVSIKSLGRVRQKYANADTLVVLNFQNYIQITTIGEYLPKKFVQGYEI